MYYIALLLLSPLLKIVTAEKPLHQEQPLRQLVCEHETLFLSCPKGYVINVLTALNGKKVAKYCNQPGNHRSDCEVGNALNIMKFSCNRIQICRVKAKNNVFADPCSNTRKYLEVTYRCVEEDDEILSSVACEKEKLMINCTDGNHLWIINALYGRKDPGICFKPA
uniref:SUEL-type lectin domain-containing protein n=1 Tax=Triatoma dimidiata TaxID=72491 RepID=D1MXA7_TRIDM|nr:unnamed protein product [Triatoma dimidiata]